MSKKITLENVDSSELPEVPVIGEVKQIRFTQDMELVSTLADSDLFMIQAGADLEARPNTITFDLIIKNLSGPIEEGSKKFVTGDMMFKVIGDMNLLDTWDNTNLVSSLNATYVNVRRIEEELRREINRSTGKDEQHDEQIANLRQDLTSTNEMLNQEINRSVAKDNEHDELLEGLRDDVDSTSSKLDAEIDRSTTKDAEHDTLLKGLRVDVNANKSAIDSEVARSTARDEAHDAAISKNASDITTESSRAKAEEAKIRQEMQAADTNLQNAITAETERATGVEEDLQRQITDLSGSTDDRLEALEALSHEQNTDTGTTSKTFVIDSGNTGAMLKAEGGGLSTRTKGDAGYANFTVQNLVIKGDVTQEGDTFITQAERVEVRDNMILINEGETGAGVTAGFAGIEVDRGTEQNFMFGFNESDGMFKIGKEGNMFDVALRQPVGNMIDGMFASWDAATKTFKTTNVIPYNKSLDFKFDPEIVDATLKMKFMEAGLALSMSGDDSILALLPGIPQDEVKYSLISTNTNGIILGDSSGSNDKFILDIKKPSFISPVLDKNVIIGGKNAYFSYYSHRMGSPNTITASCGVTAPSFYRVSDSSEVLYHADIIDDLVTGGTSKVLSAEQGKILSTKVNEIGDTYLPLSAGSGKHVTGDLYLDQKIYMKTLKPIYVQDSKGNYMQVLQGATLDGEEVIQLGASSKIRVESVTDFSKAVKFKDTVTLGTNSKLYYEVSSSSSRTILDPAGGNIVLGNVNVQDMKFSTAEGKDLYHLEGTTPYKIWTAHSFDPDSKANRVNPVVEQTLTLNTSTTGYKVKLGVDDTGYPGMFVSTQAGVSKSSLYYSPKSDALEIFTGTQSGEIATQNWVIDQVPTIFYARGFEVRKLNAAVNLDSDLLYGGAAANYSDLTYWTNAPEGFSYGTVYQLGLQDYTNLNAQLAFDIIHTSDTDQKTNHLWFRTSGKAGYGVAGWKRVVTADELEGYVPSGDLTNYYTKTQSDARYWTKTELVDPATKSGNNTFTGTNSFTAGKFNVGPVNVTATGSLLIDMVNTGGWERSIMWSNNSAPASRIRFGSYGYADVAEFAWIGVGDVQYNTAQYRFYGTSMKVPSVWSLDDADGNSLIWTQSTQLAHIGRATGTTKIRSGAVDLIHTKGATDYKILDESNYSQYLPTNNKWTYGFVVTYIEGSNADFNTLFAGPDSPKIVFNYYRPIGHNTNAPTGMSYGAVLQIDGNYNSGYNNVVLRPQLAFDINHNVENGTRYMWFRTANNLGYGDSSNWKRVVTADENVAVLVMDANTYPSIARIDGTTYNWLRTPAQGLLPNTQATLDSGGTSYLGTNDWSFGYASIHTIYSKRYMFGNTGVDFRLDTNNKIAATISGSARGIEIGDLLVSSNYGEDAAKVPTNGIFASGIIKSYSGFSSDSRINNLNISKASNDALLISSFAGENVINKPGVDPVSGQSVGDGVALTYFWDGDYAFQLVGDIDGTGMAYRKYTPSTGNSTNWKFLADTKWVNTKLGGYLPLTGGILSGQLIINSISNSLILNNTNSSETESFIKVQLNGTSKAAIGFLSGSGSYIHNYENSKYLFVGTDGAYFGTPSSKARLLTSADLSSYATQSWVTSQAYHKNDVANARFTQDLFLHAASNTGGWSRSLIICQNYSNAKTGVVFGGYGQSATPTYAYIGVGDNVGYSATNSFKVYTDKVTFGNKTLATVDQIPLLSGYATQSWVTSQGYLTSHQAIYALTFAAGAFAAKTFTPTSAAVTVNVPTKTSHLTNDSGFLTSVPSTYATQSWVTSQGYLTSITKSMVTTALGYTPPTTNTTYSQATSSTLGLVKIGATGLAAKNYAVQLNSSGQMYVAVPWTDTNSTYSAATSSTYGLVKIGATGLAAKNYAVQLNSSGQMYVSVPWTDTDTNTHYTTRLYAGASGTAANAAASNPYLKVTDDNTYRNQVRFIGAGATSISSDASGNITITSKDTTYDLSSYLKENDNISKLTNDRAYVRSTSTLRVNDIQVVEGAAGTATGVLYVVLES